MRAFLKNFVRYRSSALALIIVNAVPLVGVLFWRWDVFEIVALYWAENVVIGAINVLKMITCRPQPGRIDWDQPFTPDELTALRETLDDPNHVPGGDSDFTELTRLEAAFENAQAKKKRISLPGGSAQLPYVFGFAFFYGWFCLLHGMFVYGMFGAGWGPPFESIFLLSKSVYEKSFWPVMALAASHLYSFVVNYLGRGEFRRVTVGSLTFEQPFARVVLLHLAILLTGFVCVLFGSPLPLLVLLVVGKTTLDLLLHLRERERNAEGDPGRPPVIHGSSPTIKSSKANQVPAKRPTSMR